MPMTWNMHIRTSFASVHTCYTLALNWGSKFQLLSGIKKQKLNKWVKPVIIEQKNPKLIIK